MNKLKEIPVRKRLRIYQKALRDYRLSSLKYIGWLFAGSDTLNGISHYFYLQTPQYVHDMVRENVIKINNNIKTERVEHEKLFPEVNLFIDINLPQPFLQMPGGKGSWKEEINEIKNAIKLCKENIKNGNS